MTLAIIRHAKSGAGQILIHRVDELGQVIGTAVEEIVLEDGLRVVQHDRQGVRCARADPGRKMGTRGPGSRANARARQVDQCLGVVIFAVIDRYTVRVRLAGPMQINFLSSRAVFRRLMVCLSSLHARSLPRPRGSFYPAAHGPASSTGSICP